MPNVSRFSARSLYSQRGSCIRCHSPVLWCGFSLFNHRRYGANSLASSTPMASSRSITLAGLKIHRPSTTALFTHCALVGWAMLTSSSTFRSSGWSSDSRPALLGRSCIAASSSSSMASWKQSLTPSFRSSRDGSATISFQEDGGPSGPSGAFSTRNTWSQVC